MKVCLVNLFDLDPPRNGGMSRVAHLVSRILADYAKQGRLKVYFAVGWHFSNQFRDWLGYSGGEVVPVLPESERNPLLESFDPDLVISPLFGMMPISAWESYQDIPHIVCMPDALALDKPELFQADELEHRRKTYNQLKQASLVVTISQDARQRIIHHLGLEENHVAVIPLAGNLQTHLETSSEKSQVKLPSAYVFYPANDWPHKRHDLLMRVMSRIWKTREDIFLVLTGWHAPNYISELASQYNCPQDKIVDLGYVSNSDLVYIYQSAEALLFVSEYEGFCMPVLEAMQNGCPVICAPLTSLPEVAGDAALYVSSDNPADWANAFLGDLPLERETLIKRGYQQAQKFSWEKTEAQWGDLLESRFDFTNGRERTIDSSFLLQELESWVQNYATAQQELAEKENMIKEIQSALRAKEKGIDDLELKLRDTKKTMLHFHSDYRYWLLNGPLRHSRLYRYAIEWLFVIRRFFLPRLGVIEQHPPQKLEIPAHYQNEPVLPGGQLPVISIVTPSFNQARFLPRTIQSVLNQSYPKLEYVIQDGGSIDGTDQILDMVRDQVHYVESRQDEGQAHAINLGFRHSSGEIMAYLNSDDMLVPGTLHYVAKYFVEHPDVDVVYGHRIIVDEEDREIGIWIMPRHDPNILFWADYIPQETLFWRRNIWESAGGSMDESFQFALDWDMLVRFQRAGAKIVRLPRFLGIFRYHTAQKTASQMDTRGLQEMAFMREKLHGRKVGWQEILKNIKPYLRRSAIYHKLYRFGILRY